MNYSSAAGGGLAGAIAVSVIHETVRRFVPLSPRMDLLGKQALSLLLKNAGKAVPGERKLYGITLAGDLLSNSLYYSLAGANAPKNIWFRGTLLGLAAGIGAVVLPKPLGLKEEYSNRSTQTKVMTIGLYVLGGIITAAAMDFLRKKE